MHATVVVTKSADIKVNSTSVPTITFVPNANQVVINVTTNIHNNGPETANTTKSIAASPGTCDPADVGASGPFTETDPPSVTRVEVDTIAQGLGPAQTSCTYSVQVCKATNAAHLTDPTPANNCATDTGEICLDMDSDGVCDDEPRQLPDGPEPGSGRH